MIHHWEQYFVKYKNLLLQVLNDVLPNILRGWLFFLERLSWAEVFLSNTGSSYMYCLHYYFSLDLCQSLYFDDQNIFNVILYYWLRCWFQFDVIKACKSPAWIKILQSNLDALCGTSSLLKSFYAHESSLIVSTGLVSLRNLSPSALLFI